MFNVLLLMLSLSIPLQSPAYADSFRSDGTGVGIFPDPPAATVGKQEETQPYCVEALRSIQKWGVALHMKEWKIALYCTNRPPWEDPKDIETGLRGSSLTFSDHMTLYVWIKPNDPEVEHVCIHELLHGILKYAEDANSGVVNENTVMMLADLYNAYNVSLMRHDKSEEKLTEEINAELAK